MTFQGLARIEVALLQQVLAGVDGVGVEIGCYEGYSTKVILGASDLTLISIDPMTGDSEEASLVPDEAKLRANLAGYEDRWYHVREESILASEFVKDGALDGTLTFVFIDGNHKYEEALFDVAAWGEHLRKGGLLAVHDCRMSRPDGAPFHPGPSRVADEHLFGKPEGWDVVGEAFSLAIFRKLPS